MVMNRMMDDEDDEEVDEDDAGLFQGACRQREHVEEANDERYYWYGIISSPSCTGLERMAATYRRFLPQHLPHFP